MPANGRLWPHAPHPASNDSVCRAVIKAGLATASTGAAEAWCSAHGAVVRADFEKANIRLTSMAGGSGSIESLVANIATLQGAVTSLAGLDVGDEVEHGAAERGICGGVPRTCGPSAGDRLEQRISCCRRRRGRFPGCPLPCTCSQCCRCGCGAPRGSRRSRRLQQHSHHHQHNQHHQ